MGASGPVAREALPCIADSGLGLRLRVGAVLALDGVLLPLLRGGAASAARAAKRRAGSEAPADSWSARRFRFEDGNTTVCMSALLFLLSLSLPRWCYWYSQHVLQLTLHSVVLAT